MLPYIAYMDPMGIVIPFILYPHVWFANSHLLMAKSCYVSLCVMVKHCSRPVKVTQVLMERNATFLMVITWCSHGEMPISDG